MDPFFNFGDPFAGFGGFGTFRPPRSLLSNFFGGRGPFDDPFFTRPPGSIFQSTSFGLSGDLFPLHMHPPGFLEHQALEPRKSRGVIIEELNSDSDKEDAEEEEKHVRSGNEPFVEQPDEEAGGKRRKYLQDENGYYRFNNTRPMPQPHRLNFESSIITNGGTNGIYYTSSETRSTGNDGAKIFPFTPFGLCGDLSPLHMHPSGFLERRTPEPRKSRGPIIEELNDDEKVDAVEEKKENPRKLSRSDNEPSVKHPEEESERKRKRWSFENENEYGEFNNIDPMPQPHIFNFQSSVITYGGANGTYYTSSNTRRTGSDGVTFEECKEANSATREATHKISRGIHNKGNSVSRKLNSNGKVETVHTLYNLNEDELPTFEEAWKGKARKYFPGSVGVSSSAQEEQATQAGWALSSKEEHGATQAVSTVLSL